MPVDWINISISQSESCQIKIVSCFCCSSTNITLHLSIERVNTKSDKFWFFGLCAVLALAVFFVYWPVRNHDFIKYDDDKYVTDNRNVQSGLNWQSIRWAFTTGHASNWHPLSWLSHTLDCKIFGLNPGRHHLINVLFHIANTLLLFIVLTRMTGTFWPSAFVAAVFGLHPLHIESVAWVAERKDVLSTFFWMLTMLAYAWYAEKPKIMKYLLMLLLFVLGLMAKPMLVTLPFVLLLIDYWPLERIQFAKPGAAKSSQSNNYKKAVRQKPLFFLLLEKVPLMFFAAASCIVTFIVQRSSGAVQTMEAMDIKSRTGNAIVAYIGYIEKMFWPGKLAVLYPHPGGSLSMGSIIICGLLLIMLSFCFIVPARRHKYLAVGWLWYVGTLVPVIGLVQVGVQAMADRYTYIPLTGLFIVITWGIIDIFPKSNYRKTCLTVLAIAVLSALTIKTSLQLQHWQNSVTLFKHTLAATNNNYVMHNNYANFLMDAGEINEAIEHFNSSLKIKPGNAEAYNNLGNAFSRFGKIDDAIEQYRKAVTLKPNLPDAHYNMALALSKQKRTEESIKEYYESLRLAPDNVDALSNLGFEFAQQGSFEQAIEFYKKAIAIEPANIITHGRLGLAMASAGKIDEAIKEFRIVLEDNPKDVEMWCNLGVLLEKQNKITEAIEQYRRALQIDPEDVRAQNLLKAALEKK